MNLLERANANLTLPVDMQVRPIKGLERLASKIKCRKGVIAAIPQFRPKKQGQILIPDTVSDHICPDVMHVVSSGEEGYEVGDVVLAIPWAGRAFTPFKVGHMKAWEVRFYGLVSGMNEDKVVLEPVSDCVPAKMIGDTLTPYKDWVLLRRDALKTTSGFLSLELPDDAKYRTWKATVVSAGPDAEGPEGEAFVPGQRVLYNGPSIVIGIKDAARRFGSTEDSDDYCLIRAGNIYCVLDENS